MEIKEIINTYAETDQDTILKVVENSKPYIKKMIKDNPFKVLAFYPYEGSLKEEDETKDLFKQEVIDDSETVQKYLLNENIEFDAFTNDKDIFIIIPCSIGIKREGYYEIKESDIEYWEVIPRNNVFPVVFSYGSGLWNINELPHETRRPYLSNICNDKAIDLDVMDLLFENGIDELEEIDRIIKGHKSEQTGKAANGQCFTICRFKNGTPAEDDLDFLLDSQWIKSSKWDYEVWNDEEETFFLILFTFKKKDVRMVHGIENEIITRLYSEESQTEYVPKLDTYEAVNS